MSNAAEALGAAPDVASTPDVSSTYSAGDTSPKTTPPPLQDVTKGWLESYDPAQKMYIENKGFKDANSIVDSYRNLESLMGAREKLVKLPDSEDSADWGDVYNKLGRPETSNDYNMKFGENADEGFTKWAKDSFHELGLSSKQASKLSEKWTEYQTGETQKLADQYQEGNAQDMSTLKMEWGRAYNANVEQAKQAARAFDLNTDMIDKLEDSLGFAGTMRFFQKVGSKLGEGQYIEGGQNTSNFGALKPVDALEKIAMLKQDPEFIRRYTGGDLAAKTEIEKYFKWAYPTQRVE